MPLFFDLVENFEFESRIVDVVVTGAADLQDHTRIALVAE